MIGLTFLADNVRETHGRIAVQGAIVATGRRLRGIRADEGDECSTAYAGCDNALNDVGIYALCIV